METTAVLVPSYGRPDTLARLAEDLRASTDAPYRLYFVLEQDDEQSIEVATRIDADVIINVGEKRYAACINAAYLETSEPFLFLGADDIRFGSGWLEAGLEAMADPLVSVVGTVDPLHEYEDQSTHHLVRRTYIEEQSGCMDIPNIVLYPYHHAYTDWEFTAVAKVRGVYAYCEDSIVEHHHPGWLTDGTVDHQHDLFDETYAKGNVTHLLDRQEWIRRSSMWAREFRRRPELSRPDWAMLRVIDQATLRGRCYWRMRTVARRLVPSFMRPWVRKFEKRIRTFPGTASRVS